MAVMGSFVCRIWRAVSSEKEVKNGSHGEDVVLIRKCSFNLLSHLVNLYTA